MKHTIKIPVITYVTVEVDDYNLQTATNDGYFDSYEYWEFDYDNSDLRDMMREYEELVKDNPVKHISSVAHYEE